MVQTANGLPAENGPSSPARSPMFGSNQKIAIGAVVLPFAVATVALFTEYCAFSEWALFVGPLVGGVTGMTLGGSYLVKKAEAQLAAALETPAS